MGRPKASELITPKEDYATAWYSALHSKVGITVSAFPRDAVYQRLLQVRREINDPLLLGLEIVKPAHAENELWIIRKRT